LNITRILHRINCCSFIKRFT